MRKKLLISFLFFVLLYGGKIVSQESLKGIVFDPGNKFGIKSIIDANDLSIDFSAAQPLFSVLIDSVLFRDAMAFQRNDTLYFQLADSLKCFAYKDTGCKKGVKLIIRFQNTGKAGHKIENLVPLGENSDKVYITAAGSKEWPGYLCRSRLYRPGYGPVGVVLPDNAWHMGFADIRLNQNLSVTAIARRGQRDKELTTIDRWAVTLKPGGWVEYSWYIDSHQGDWHEGLKMMFSDRWLYDLPEFDNSMFLRSDLAWMKNRYIMLLQFAWDKKYYDYQKHKHTFYENLFEFDSLTGGYDIFTLWPTWPRLGLDPRNQWDMYRDLPGGLAELRRQADFTHKSGKKYFISYNPWDEGTRKEDHLKGMEELLRATDADGVVLDTRGESSRELQAAADKVKPGIIMYSEGMAVPKDMPGIVSGRVHDALVMPPPLNLNKLIKPDFAIFRVLQLADDRLHRELAIAFFNGYGVEINSMRPGRPDWIAEEYAYMGRTTKILRENNSAFHNTTFLPLLPTLVDSVYVNQWDGEGKRIYTIYSVNPRGNSGPLFSLTVPGEVDPKTKLSDYHVVDLWNHLELEPLSKDGQILIPVAIDAFDRAWLGSRREGNVGSVALFNRLLTVKQNGPELVIKANFPKADRIVVTGENPTYRSQKHVCPAGGATLNFHDLFPTPVGKIVLQLFGGSELFDEVVVTPAQGLPLLISAAERTPVAEVSPAGMVEIPSGSFRFYTKRDPNTLDPFIPFPDFSDTVTIEMPRFFMDEYPVTNLQFSEFIEKSGYQPKDTINYLRHWIKGKPTKEMMDLPVVYISQEDAKAYAKWAGKRLPGEREWQYAAQGGDMRKYPWGNTMDSTKCNYNLNYPTSVNAFPSGASPFGVKDVVGNVWQMTADVYDNGSYYYNIIRGGSFYHPTQSIWYVTGGPLPVDHPEMLLLIAPGLDRNATVGFRCAKDVK